MTFPDIGNSFQSHMIVTCGHCGSSKLFLVFSALIDKVTIVTSPLTH